MSNKMNRNELMGIGVFFLWIGLLVYLSITKQTLDMEFKEIDNAPNTFPKNKRIQELNV